MPRSGRATTTCAKVVAVPQWIPIENVLLRGGPCDGDRLKDLNLSELGPEISVPTATGRSARYRKTDECEQLRGAGMSEPYSRLWIYEWSSDD